MAFDPSRDAPRPREAAAVILVRACPRGGTEVFMLRRHRRSSFMGSAFVFPGGAAEPEDGAPRVTAARELFEEAGVLLAEPPPAAPAVAAWRAELLAGRATLADVLAAAGSTVAVDSLRYFAHWITPAAESKRFSATFFVACLPPGQTPSFDDRETVEEIWVTPDEALDRAGELRLPPPQVRTMIDLRDAARRGPTAVCALADARARDPHPVLPRFAPVMSAPNGFALLLPWDPDYERAGMGDALAMPADHPLAVGPSRFILDETTWKNVDAPRSSTAG